MTATLEQIRPGHQVTRLEKIPGDFVDAVEVACTCGAGVFTSTIQEAAAWWAIHRDSA